MAPLCYPQRSAPRSDWKTKGCRRCIKHAFAIRIVASPGPCFLFLPSLQPHPHSLSPPSPSSPVLVLKYDRGRVSTVGANYRWWLFHGNGPCYASVENQGEGTNYFRCRRCFLAGVRAGKAPTRRSVVDVFHLLTRQIVIPGVPFLLAIATVRFAASIVFLFSFYLAHGGGTATEMDRSNAWVALRGWVLVLWSMFWRIEWNTRKIR